MKRIRLRTRLLALALVLQAACGGDGSGRVDGGSVEGAGNGGAGTDARPGASGGDASPGRTPAGDSGTVGAAADSEAGAVVEVWFSRGESPVAVERRVEGRRVGDALQALLEGPTAAESAAGLSSWFSVATADALVSVRADSGHFVVDFRDLPRLIPSASSSAGSHQLLASLDSTVFQFPDVRSVEYRLEGSCQAFWEWLQRGCEVVRRPG